MKIAAANDEGLRKTLAKTIRDHQREKKHGKEKTLHQKVLEKQFINRNLN